MNNHRKIRHFRKLSELEIVLLIHKSLGHLLISQRNQQLLQLLELKFSYESLRQLGTQAKQEKDNLLLE